MALRLGFHRTLFKLGNWRFGIGYGFHGITGFCMLIIFGILNLCWYMILGVMWLFYGIFYLFILLPIKGISKIINKNKNPKVDNAENTNLLIK